MPVTFDKAKDAHVCSVHGEVQFTGWKRCWNGCDDGHFDAYESDPLMADPGDLERCSVCHGKGGWNVCGLCVGDDDEVEW